MIDFDERWYYIARAMTCRKQAEQAADPRSAEVHMEFRRLYLERADSTPLRLRQAYIDNKRLAPGYRSDRDPGGHEAGLQGATTEFIETTGRTPAADEIEAHVREG